MRLICPKNLAASEKIAVVLVKGISKANYESVQPYLEVIHEFVLPNHEHQELRMWWVVGRQGLMVSTISKVLSAMNSYSLEERIYEFQSALHIETGTSLLEPLYTQNKRTENLCMLILQELLKLCNESYLIRHYVWNMGPPNYLLAKYVDFFEEFIQRYTDEAKRLYGYSGSTGFNKEELAKNTKRLHQEVKEKIEKETPKEEEPEENQPQGDKPETEVAEKPK